MSSRGLLPGKPVPPLGYGCYALSGAYGASLGESEMIRVLQYAYELGIRFYDTSSSYTGTEEILGRALKGFRDNIVISSKVGVGKGNTIDLSMRNIRDSCESSLKKLGTDYLDLYMVHYHDPYTPVEDTLQALEALKKEGKILNYGVGHLPMDKTLEYLKLGNTAVVLAELSPVNICRYRELRRFQASFGFDIVAFSITGRGMLSGRINPDTEFSNMDIRRIDSQFKGARLDSGLRITEKLREIGNLYGKTPAQVAVSWTIQRPGVAAGLTGPTQMEHLYENSQVLNWSLDGAAIEEINSFIEKEGEWLEKSMYREVQNILGSPLSMDIKQASSDIIYVLEWAVERGFVSYEKAADCFRRVMEAGKADYKSSYVLAEIKEELGSMPGVGNGDSGAHPQLYGKQ